MYAQHWGIRCSPFTATAGDNYFYRSPIYDEALSRLEFLVQSGCRCGLLLGDTGTGKSIVQQEFARQQRRETAAVAQFSVLGLSRQEFLWTLAAEMGSNPSTQTDEFACWRLVRDSLAKLYYQQQRFVVLLDDVDEAGTAGPGTKPNREVLACIAILVRQNAALSSATTVIMSSRLATAGKVGKSLLDLAELRIDLVPWDEKETSNYITELLRQAGRDAPIFTKQALERIFALTRGVPRRINQLADLALIAGAGTQIKEIDADVIDNVSAELGVGEPVKISANTESPVSLDVS